MGHLTRIANAVVQSLEGGPVQTQVSEVLRGERLQAQVSLLEVPCPCPRPLSGRDQHWYQALGPPSHGGCPVSWAWAWAAVSPVPWTTRACPNACTPAPPSGSSLSSWLIWGAWRGGLCVLRAAAGPEQRPPLARPSLPHTPRASSSRSGPPTGGPPPTPPPSPRTSWAPSLQLPGTGLSGLSWGEPEGSRFRWKKAGSLEGPVWPLGQEQHVLG